MGTKTRTIKETQDFLDSLMWKRYTKKELESLVQKFFNSDNKLSEDECVLDEEDYCFVFTTETLDDNGYIDIAIWFLETRVPNTLIITGVELLNYVK